jgi:DNA-binding transcriptional regulator of glucitol operon
MNWCYVFIQWSRYRRCFYNWTDVTCLYNGRSTGGVVITELMLRVYTMVAVQVLLQLNWCYVFIQWSRYRRCCYNWTDVTCLYNGRSTGGVVTTELMLRVYTMVAVQEVLLQLNWCYVSIQWSRYSRCWYNWTYVTCLYNGRGSRGVFTTELMLRVCVHVTF